MELLPFVDILKVFNNPINEEQAWAVCHQCAHFLFRNPQQEFYQVVFDSGINSIWLSRHGDVLLRKGPTDPNGSGKGPPQGHPQSPPSTILPRKKRHVMATETDAVQALGTAIFEALDYGIEASEERQLSSGLESLIATMTNADCSLDYDPEAGTADDEGIEKDADLEPRCTVIDVIKLCSQHVSSKQDAQHHFKAVCRALATEAGELFTFLDKISSGREKLSETADEDARRLEELQRADWACLWVQVMRSLRQGVLLKKIEHIHHPPLEYELTPFEMLLEDIRTRRYTLHKIMVNGEIPHKVKSDAHAVILNFIRSRPPLKRVDDRKLKPKPPSPPDPHELLLTDIRARPKLRPVRDGKLVVRSQKSTSSVSSCDSEDDPVEKPVKRVIKPDFNLLLNNSFEESSEEEEHSDLSCQGSPLSHSSPVHSGMAATTASSWQRAVTRENLMNDSGRPSRLQRRHTIMICESPLEGKVAHQELPPLEEEEDEPSPVRESHCLVAPHASQKHAILARTASDNDLLAQVTLRHPQSHGGRRLSLDHRRSLTSLTTGLCAIPELEDSPGASDSPPPARPNSAHILRSWSHEQAPPPNPSPPCKGRARAALGMGMTGMKPVGGPFQPLSQRQSQLKSGFVPSKLASMSSGSALTSSVASGAVPSTSSSFLSSQKIAIQSQSQHASLLPVSSSTSASSTSSSSSSSITLCPTKHANLDLSVSSQSPVFFKKTRALHSQSAENKSPSPPGSVEQDRHVARWRLPKAREERLSKQRQSRELSQRPIAEGEESFDNALPLEPEDTFVSEEEMRSRRLSLDSGVPMYSGTNNRVSVPVGGEDTRKVTRRLSLGMRGRELSGPLRQRTPEEEERVSRWRSLQEDDLASRTAPRGSSVYLRSVEPSHQDDPPSLEGASAEPTEQRKKLEPQPRRLIKGMTLPSEGTDVLQQKMANEEARFTRWRRLEESGGIDECDNSASAVGSDAEYVSAALSSRVQSAASSNPASSGTSLNSSQPSVEGVATGMLPLSKRWQNPVECLSLTLEEVTHIRSVLTKAELESLLSHPDLYQQVSKNKLCFTCKTTRFSLFGEWGTKCKFCKRTVCSKCLRKMNVPTDHFRNIPVYTLSPAPLTPQMQEFIQNFIKTAPPCSVPPTRDVSPSRDSVLSRLSAEAQQSQDSSGGEASSEPSSASRDVLGRTKTLQRSQSALVPGQKSLGSLSARASIKGPVMAICCDCKGMVMEIIRASRASLAMLSASGSSANSSLSTPATSSLSSTTQSWF